MTNKISLMLFFALNIFTLNAQVGIGTTTPSPSSILELSSTTQTFVPPRMTNTQMLAINSPLIGSVIFNTSDDALYMYSSLGWQNISRTSNPTILLNKNFTGPDTIISTSTDTYTNFPLNHLDVSSITSSVYTVLGNGKIRINDSGFFLLNTAFSVENVPSGNRKFVIAINKNGSIIGYPSRGTINLTSTDTWGTSGSIVEQFMNGDIIDIRYVLNNDGIPLNALNFNIAITKLK